MSNPKQYPYKKDVHQFHRFLSPPETTQDANRDDDSALRRMSDLATCPQAPVLRSQGSRETVDFSG